MKSNIKNTQEKLRNSNNLLDLDAETLRYGMKPIGKAIIRGRPKKKEDEKAKPSDKVKCDICGETFIRSNRYNHNKKNKVHQAYAKMNSKMKNILLSD